MTAQINPHLLLEVGAGDRRMARMRTSPAEPIVIFDPQFVKECK
jgi:hypothetical protein